MVLTDDITQILASIHWLPVHFKIDFKVLLITFKARLCLAASYIAEMLIPYEPLAAFDPQVGPFWPFQSRAWNLKLTVLCDVIF